MEKTGFEVETEKFLNLTIERYETNIRGKIYPAARIYRGKSLKSKGFYFTCAVNMEDWITKQKENAQANADLKAQYAAKRKAFVTSFKVGDILDSSWGYDQTNVDFYQVIKVVSAKMIVIQEIDSRRTEKDGGCSMSCYVTAVKDAFKKDSVPMRKMVQPMGSSEYVRLTTYSSADRWDGKEKYCSWYA